MKISAKIDYALRSVTELGLRHSSQVPVRIQEISEAQDIPKKFLVHVLIGLKNAGIVQSIRGNAGGYVLAKEPSAITVAEIVNAIDDSVIGTNEERGRKNMDRMECYYHRMWRGVNAEIAKKLEGVTIEDVMRDMNKDVVSYQI